MVVKLGITWPPRSPRWVDGWRERSWESEDVGFVVLQQVGEWYVGLELLLGEGTHGLQVGMELGNHSQVNVQLALDNVAERDVIREPKLISGLNKFTITEIILVDYPCSGFAE